MLDQFQIKSRSRNDGQSNSSQTLVKYQINSRGRSTLDELQKMSRSRSRYVYIQIVPIGQEHQNLVKLSFQSTSSQTLGRIQSNSSQNIVILQIQIIIKWPALGHPWAPPRDWPQSILRLPRGQTQGSLRYPGDPSGLVLEHPRVPSGTLGLPLGKLGGTG